MPDAAADLRAAAEADRGLVLLEGFHALKHALRFGADVGAAQTADPERLEALRARYAPDLQFAGLVRPVARAALGPRPHPTGVLALARRPPFALDRLAAGPVVLLEDPRHAGNVGAVVRVAAAAGAGGVCTTGPLDPWTPAALRGAAGLHFALPVGQGRPGGRPLIAFDAAGEPPGPLPDGAVLAFGTERDGLRPETLAAADARVAIPMRPGVSSLNLATAVAVALYSARSGFSQRSMVHAASIPRDS